MHRIRSVSLEGWPHLANTRKTGIKHTTVRANFTTRVDLVFLFYQPPPIGTSFQIHWRPGQSCGTFHTDLKHCGTTLASNSSLREAWKRMRTGIPGQACCRPGRPGLMAMWVRVAWIPVLSSVPPRSSVRPRESEQVRSSTTQVIPNTCWNIESGASGFEFIAGSLTVNA